VTPNVVSSDPGVATIKKNEERIEDLILIRLKNAFQGKIMQKKLEIHRLESSHVLSLG
jgi:hypothetical protein